MKFSDYQRQLAQLESERGWDRVLPSHTFLHMGEELGEIGRVLQRIEGYRAAECSTTELADELAGELADLSAFIFKLASQYHIDMDQTMQAHLEKFRARFGDIEQSREDMARYIRCQEKNLAWIKSKN